MSTRLLLAAGLGLGCGLALGACNWSAFDDVSDSTWVDTVGTPDGLTSRWFGEGVAASDSTSVAGANIYAVGRNADIVAHLAYDGSGALTETAEPLVPDNQQAMLTPLPPFPPLVGDRYSDAVLLACNKGSPPGLESHVFAFHGNAATFDREMVIAFDGTQADLDHKSIVGLAVAQSNAGDVTKPDLAYVRGDEVGIIVDYAEGSAGALTIHDCEHGAQDAYAVVAGDLIASSPGDEIIIGVGNESRQDAPSQVVIYDGQHVIDGDTDVDLSRCADARSPLANLQPPNSETDFGARLVIGDFVGDAALDLAVSAPRANTVYVYSGEVLAGGAGGPTPIVAPAPTDHFGDALAAGNLDGSGKDELVIGDPYAVQEGVQQAGGAFVYANGAIDAPTFVLYDAEPDDAQHFGQSLAIVPFGSNAKILVCGADQEVFTYFRTPLSADVRTP